MNNSQSVLTIYPRRRPQITTLVICLLALALIGNVILYILQTPYGIVVDILFAVLLLLCLVFLAGFVWSALRLLTSGQPSLQADEQSLTLNHMPFLNTLTLRWSEIKSIHIYHYLFLTYLCIVPEDVNQLLKQTSLWRLALNASARFSLRTSAPLNISQGLFDRSVNDLLLELHKMYRVKITEDQRAKKAEEVEEQQGR